MHFVALGATLFAAKVMLVTPSPRGAVAVRLPIVISAAQIKQLRAGFVQRTGLTPTADDETFLIDEAIEEELLYRAAVERGLDRQDRSVRFRLAEKMRFLIGSEDQNPEQLYREAIDLGLDRDDPIIRRMMVEKMRLLATASEDDGSGERELQAYFARNQQRFVQPPRITLTHVFISAQKRGATTEKTAARLLAALQAESIGPERAIVRGDPFPLGHRFVSHSISELRKTFGAQFATAIAPLPPGAWYGPVPSPYGLHLVWIEASDPAHVPPLDAVRRQVLEGMRAERRDQRMREVVRQLHRQYVIRVERPAEAGHG